MVHALAGTCVHFKCLIHCFVYYIIISVNNMPVTLIPHFIEIGRALFLFFQRTFFLWENLLASTPFLGISKGLPLKRTPFSKDTKVPSIYYVHKREGSMILSTLTCFHRKSPTIGKIYSLF